MRARALAALLVCAAAAGAQERPDFTGQLQSYHVPDAMGWDLQIGNKIGPSTWGE